MRSSLELKYQIENLSQEPTLSSKKVLIALSIYKFLIFNIAYFFMLGPYFPDNQMYLNSNIQDLVNEPMKILGFTGTNIVRLLGFILHKLTASEYLSNLFFTVLSFCGLAYLIRKIQFKQNLSNYIIIAFLFLPTFTLFSSIASKEAVNLFLASIFLGKVHFLWQEKAVHKIGFQRFMLVMVCLFLIILFKPLYILFLFPFCLFLQNKIYLHFNSRTQILFFMLYIILLILLIYWFDEEINSSINNSIIPLFYSADSSTRDNPFLNDSTYFTHNLLINLLNALWSAPYLNELYNSYQIATFMESLFVLAGISLIFGLWLMKVIKTDFDLTKAIVLGFLIVMSLLSLAPMAIMNSGSAIRYRADVWLYFVVFIYYFVNNFYSAFKIKK